MDCCATDFNTICARFWQIFFWSLYILSPVAIILVMLIDEVPIAEHDNDDSYSYAFLTIWLFSAGLNGLYIYPWFYHSYTWPQRLHVATMNWICLSTFEEIVFQLPQIMFEQQLMDSQGKNTVVEWPFFSYGLCDSRWDNYNNGNGLAWEIWTNNLLEGTSGLIVISLELLQRYFHKKLGESENSKAKNCLHSVTMIFILVLVFRDAMLFRQTFSYFSDQHVVDYEYSLHDPKFRAHGIIGLYTINALWIICPITTMIWAYLRLSGRNMKKFVDLDHAHSGGAHGSYEPNQSNENEVQLADVV